ncbi:MAG: universal stress protein [Pseudomonadota bacterium]|nr:universal stress protein [Acidobacteriota bacterium]MBU1338897.1 universal stress protein [Acidobacteriota bacterium]MBU1474108.1 universal stress protein [Acidobacteriota bacterium]MBU2437929.1 universal stress protein [Acidobacteriota bacterium]
MISHILVPLDGSPLAECVLPHVLAVAQAVDARLTLLHVLERPRETGELPTDPLHWHLKKSVTKVYLDQITARLQYSKLDVTNTILEGMPAELVVEYANNKDVDLIALSTHGRSGLSGWNVSSVVQKIILRAHKSTLLVRAYKPLASDLGKIHAYKRLFVGLDCSARAEMVLPVAIGLSQFYKAKLTLGMVIRNPELLHRFPPSDEDQKLVNRISNRNKQAAEHYFKQLSSQFSLQGINLQTRIIASDNVIATLHDMVDQEKTDLVILVAHGRSAEGRWPYGSVATSFISFGNTALMIVQDLTSNETRYTQAEKASREIKGH